MVKVLPAETGKLVQKLRQLLPPALALLSEPIEAFKGLRFAGIEDAMQPRNPVRALAVNQMTHYIEGAPAIVAFVAGGPRFGQIAQQCVESRRRAAEQRHGLREVVFHQVP